MAKKRTSRKKNINLVTRIIWGLSIIMMVILGYFIFKANVLPLKYFILIVIILVLFLAIHGLIVMKKSIKSWIKMTVSVIGVLFIALEIFAVFKINDVLSFLDKIQARYEVNIYNIVVNANSPYQSLEDVKDKTIQTVKDFEDLDLFEKNVHEKLNGAIEYQENIVELLTQIKTDTEMVLVVNSGNYDAMIENDKDFEKEVRVLDTIEIKIKIEQEDKNLNVTKDPFVVYLSGIDTRSNYLPSRSLSDVNIILAINPVKKKILMIHIPRDYYVQIHGTTGLRDKLTHAGTIGGIEASMSTIEDLLEIEIPYYVRVNFNAVVKLVDAIGGINIYSDVNYTFNCWTDNGCTFYPGYNSVGGRCALAFARERHAYDSGDRHRGENQEQVMQLIINKVSSSSTLIANYNQILNALEGTFETSLSSEEITNLVKMQINDMASWTMETANVDGTGANLPTYSYPGQNLYVMEPKMETVESAIQKLNEVLETPDE